LTKNRPDGTNRKDRLDGSLLDFYPLMDIQFLPKSPRQRTLALAIAAAALTAGIGYYGIAQFSPASRPPEVKERSTLVGQQVVALGHIEPQTEVIKVSVPAALSNDRVAQLAIERGQKVNSGQLIAILDSKTRFERALQEAKEQVKVANTKLAQIEAGAKSGEIAAQKSQVQRWQYQRQGEARAQQEIIARIKVQWEGDKNAQQETIARIKAQGEGDENAQLAVSSKIQVELANARTEVSRYQQLAAQGAISQSVFDTKKLAVDSYTQQLKESQAIRWRSKRTNGRQLREAQATLAKIDRTNRQQLKEAQAVLTRINLTGTEQVREAKANLDRISEVRPVDIRAAQAEVDRAVAAVKRAEADLQQAEIRAPISGQILDIFAKPGEVVKDNGIANLGQNDRMQVVAEVDQSDIAKVQLGQTASLTGEAFSGTLQGNVSEIGLEVNRQSTFSTQPGENLDRRVVKVRIRLNLADSNRVASLTNLQVQVAIAISSPRN
jgi:HlyD family secretion protein